MIIDSLLHYLSGDLPGPLNDYWYGPVGQATTAGPRIDEYSGLNYSACWAATRLLSGTAACLPFNLYEKTGSERRVAEEHNVHKIIHDAFNPQVMAIMGRATGVNQQVNWGGFYAEIERDGRNNSLYLWQIHPSRVRIYFDDDKSLWYRIRNNDGTTSELPQQDVFHVPSMISDDGILGKGVIRHARETIGHGIATEQYGAAWFGNGGRIQGVLKHPKSLPNEARANLRREWNDIYGSFGSTNKTAVLSEGVEYQSIATSPQDSQFLESRQHNIEEIARWYGVPPHLIGHLLRSTNNNIEHQGIEFVTYSLIPWLKLWETQVWTKLLTKEEQPRFYAKHVVDALERGDLTSRTAALAQQFFNGALSLNQWADLEDRDPIGPLGDLRFIQTAMTTLEKAVAAPAPGQAGDAPAQPGTPAPSKDKPTNEPAAKNLAAEAELIAATLSVIEDMMDVMLDREIKEAQREAKKPAAFLQWIDGFYLSHSERMTRALHRPVRAYLLASGDLRDPKEITAAAVTLHVEASRAAMLSATEVQPEALVASVEATTAPWKSRNELLTALSQVKI